MPITTFQSRVEVSRRTATVKMMIYEGRRSPAAVAQTRSFDLLYAGVWVLCCRRAKKPSVATRRLLGHAFSCYASLTSEKKDKSHFSGHGQGWLPLQRNNNVFVIQFESDSSSAEDWFNFAPH